MSRFATCNECYNTMVCIFVGNCCGLSMDPVARVVIKDEQGFSTQQMRGSEIDQWCREHGDVAPITFNNAPGEPPSMFVDSQGDPSSDAFNVLLWYVNDGDIVKTMTRSEIDQWCAENGDVKPFYT